jgi:hypothetical protein
MKKPKAIKPKWFIINTNPYNQDVLVTINMRSKEINKLLKRFHGIDPLSDEHNKQIDEKRLDEGLFFYNHKSKTRMIILFPKDTANLICLFDHEKVHAIHDIMDCIGMKLSSKTEEAYAYLSAYMMKQFLIKV